MATTKTSSGAQVELTPTIYERGSSVTPLVEFTVHTPAGTLRGQFGESAWGPSPADPTVSGVNASCTPFVLRGKRQHRLTMTIPREAFEDAIAESKQMVNDRLAEIAEENAAIESGDIPIECAYYDGEYLSGHTCHHDHARKLLAGLGLTREIDGWGTIVDRELIQALGDTFTYPAAVEFSRPKREAEVAAKADAKAARERKVEEAKAKAAETGQPVEIDRWLESCDGSVEECSTDILTRSVTPAGELTVSRIHTH